MSNNISQQRTEVPFVHFVKQQSDIASVPEAEILISPSKSSRIL